MGFSVYTLAERPEAAEQLDKLEAEAWPTYMAYDLPTVRHWHKLYSTFNEFQAVLSDDSGEVVGAGWTIPVFWDGTVSGLPAGWDAALEKGAGETQSEGKPNTLCALSAVVSRSRLGQGLSSEILKAMKTIAASHGLPRLIAPVRPNHKSRYPLTPFERYIEWKTKNGLSFDPWLRVHYRLGGVPMRVAPQSMVITGSVVKWEEWTGMSFPETGQYVVPGTLQPVQIDREQDLGRYEDPNLWVLHSVEI